MAIALSSPPFGTTLERMHADGSTRNGQAVRSELDGDELPAVAARLEAEAAAAVASLRRQAALLHARVPTARTPRRPPEMG
ncbi:hypothetical protein [Streptodolium elevatio]|uniref:Uncharacterized protein n=1 Tax=Streptodolium elevatio TaxID=3157996 RepID=A0ABV3DR32_9ACTN